MAARGFSDVQGLVKSLRIIAGSFTPQGASAPVILTGTGFSVVRTSAGLFTVTLQDTYNALISADASQAWSTPTNQAPQIGLINLPLKTIQIISAAGGTATDVPANAANIVFFTFILKNSSAKP